jgi:WhiB family redox-sensing transcriptional regulator
MTGRSSGQRPPTRRVAQVPISDLIIQGSVLPDIKWRELGACRGLEPETFYPLTEEEADQAKAVCAQCSVQTACLEFALAHREKEGIWGGATERERRRIIRQRRRSA